MLEIQSDSCTHFTPASLTLSRVDRVYTSIPAWAINAAGQSAYVPDDPKGLHERGISDHAP
eukprot:12696755-Heterocapsa_arctica.AAC.1